MAVKNQHQPAPDWDRIAARLGKQGRLERLGVYVVPVTDPRVTGAIHWSGELGAARADVQWTVKVECAADVLAKLRAGGFSILEEPVQPALGIVQGDAQRRIVARHLGPAVTMACTLRAALDVASAER
jgi:hypothetical protein